MKKTNLIVAMCGVVLVIGIVLFATKKSSAPATPATNNTTTSNTSKAAEPAIAANAVTIKDFAFSASKITVKKGTMVTWTNSDSATHTVTSESGSELDSGSLSPGKMFNHTFNTVGSFAYHCQFHSSMQGTVEVTE